MKPLRYFSQEMGYREGLKRRHRDVLQRVLFIQSGFTRQIQDNKARLAALGAYWASIKEEMQNDSKKRGATAYVKKMAKKLRYVKDENKDYLINKYLRSCKYMHALAFFKWRLAFSQRTDKYGLFEVLEDRIQFLKDQKAKQEKNI